MLVTGDIIDWVILTLCTRTLAWPLKLMNVLWRMWLSRQKQYKEPQLSCGHSNYLPTYACCSLTFKKEVGGSDFKHCSSIGLPVDTANKESSFKDNLVMWSPVCYKCIKMTYLLLNLITQNMPQWLTLGIGTSYSFISHPVPCNALPSCSSKNERKKKRMNEWKKTNRCFNLLQLT